MAARNTIYTILIALCLYGCDADVRAETRRPIRRNSTALR